MWASVALATANLVALLVAIWWVQRSAERAAERSMKAGYAFLSEMADRLQARTAEEAVVLTASRKQAEENIKVKPIAEAESLRGLVGGASVAPLRSGRAAMREKGYNPDDPEDVARWEEALGPSPFGGSVP